MQNRSRLRHFFRGHHGGVAIITAITLPLLMLAVAAVIDIGRMYSVRSKAQNAADAAILGAAASVSTVDFEAEFQNLFYANYPDGYLGSKVTAMDLALSPGTGNAVRILIDTPTIIMSRIPGAMGLENAGITTIVIEAGTNAPSCSNPNGCSLDSEIALVLDNSGSMNLTIGGGQKKIDALKEASKALVEILIGPKAVNDRVFLSVIPYDSVVNIGTGHSDWMQDVVMGPKTPIPPLPTNQGISYFVPSKLTPRDKYNDTTAQIQKGFVVGREVSMCSPYLSVANNTNSPPTVPNPRCVRYGDPVNSCVNDPETGTPRCQITRPCLEVVYDPARKPSSSAGWIWWTCIANGYSDVHDDPPTSDRNRFFTPYETTKYHNGDYVVPSYAEYTDVPAATAFPAGVSEATITGHKSLSSWVGTRPEAMAWIRNLAPVLFGSSSKSEINAAIDAMQISGDTRINIGLMWGWFTLSPKWQGLWEPGKAHLPISSPDALKSLVLMTDGKNTVHPTDNARTASLCAAVKASGITLYTVGFGDPGDIDESILKSCASKPSFYFYAPTTDDLKEVFKQIADTINQEKLVLTQ